jgi:hypothetical protein
MTSEYNFTVLIYYHYTRYSLYIVLFTAIGFISPIMLNFSPSFCIYMIFELIFVLINAHANYSKLISPISISFFKHFLIVSHWLLARRAPSCPEVNQPYFSLFVLKINSCFFIQRAHIFYCFILTTSTKFDVYTNFNIFYILYNIFHFFIKLFYFLCILWA